MRLQTVARSSASICHAGTSDARNIDPAMLLGMPLDPNIYNQEMRRVLSSLPAMSLAASCLRCI